MMDDIYRGLILIIVVISQIICGSNSEQEVMIKNRDESEDGELHSEEESNESSSEGVASGDDTESDDAGSDTGNPKAGETPWERGLRLARERAKKAKLLRQTDANVEEKKFSLYVVAPEPKETDLYSPETERHIYGDIWWSTYYKLSIVGATQWTGKRGLPCDLLPPSDVRMSRWRRRHAGYRGRRQSSTNTVDSDGEISSSNESTSASSLSSLAGSIFLAVPDLMDDDPDNSDRGRKRNGVSGTRRGSTSSSDSASSRSSRRGKHSFDSRSSSSSSSSSKRSVRRTQRRPPQREPPSQAVSWWGRGGGRYNQPVTYPQQQHRYAPVQISGYHHLQHSGSTYGRRESTENGVSANNRSPNRPHPLPSERPVKRPWVADPSQRIKTGGQETFRGRSSRSTSPTARIRRHGGDVVGAVSGHRSASSSPSRSSGSHSPTCARDQSRRRQKTTYITSWSQQAQPVDQSSLRVSGGVEKNDRASPTTPPKQPPPSQQPRTYMATTRQHLPDAGDDGSYQQGTKRDPVVRPRRRKSRSPFADIDFGSSNPTAHATALCHLPIQSSTKPTTDGPLSSKPNPISFEQTVPLLAGAVNPTAPSGGISILPSSSSRPGVKLTIAPRVKAGPGVMASSGGGGDGDMGRFSSRRRPHRSRSASPLADSLHGDASKRMRQLGYTAVSPGGFDSPPSSPPRRGEERERRKDTAGDEAYRVKAGGRRSSLHHSSDRFFSVGRGDDGRGHRSRGYCNEEFDRNRRQGAPFVRDHCSQKNRHHTSYNRRPSPPTRDESGSRRRYQRQQHRRPAPARSRSPFEGGRGDGGPDAPPSLATTTSTEQRLNELRQRLSLVDDAIGELVGGASNTATDHRR